MEKKSLVAAELLKAGEALGATESDFKAAHFYKKREADDLDHAKYIAAYDAQLTDDVCTTLRKALEDRTFKATLFTLFPDTAVYAMYGLLLRFEDKFPDLAAEIATQIAL